MEIYIDECKADIDSDTSVSLSLSVATLSDIESGKTGYTKSITLPRTPNNGALLGHPEDPSARDRFNATLHTARIVESGCTLIDGVLMMVAADRRGCGRYTFNIIGASKWWATQAAKTLRSLEIDYRATLTPQLVEQSWSGERLVRFLPVEREQRVLTNSSVSITPAERVLSMSDYHPFIHVKSVLEAIFAAAGFTIESQFMSTEWFGSLYMSGAYPSHDTAALEAKMNFCASRYNDVAATADSNGTVSANPLSNYNTVGNIVDTADPDSTDSEGNSALGVWQNGDCFGNDNGRVVFVPTEQVTVCFEYRFRYVTDYRIVSRDRLAGFDRIDLDDNESHTFCLTNTFVDRRQTVSGNHSYRIVIFDYNEGESFRLEVDQVTNPDADITNLSASDYTTVTVADIATRSATVSCATTDRLTNATLKVLVGGSYQPYQGDWALYDGYTTECGEREVEVNLTGNAKSISRSSPKYFDRIRFGGAESGMNFKLLKTTTVRPVFSPYPTIGNTIEFADIAAIDCTRIALIKALQQMFNLCFYTDPIERRVIIEPRDTFYTSSTITDLTSQIDWSYPIEVEELGSDMGKEFVLGYRTGDAATIRWNRANSTELGVWSTTIDNIFASDTPLTYLNQLFTPSVTVDEVVSGARSAELICAGDSSSYYDSRSTEQNFALKIVGYVGMKALKAGEQWSWPSYGGSYPLALFRNCNAANGTLFSLCFEDRDSVVGLHRHWDSLVELYNQSRRLTVHIRLRPSEIEQIAAPNSSKRDLRALYILSIGGEQYSCRLEEICDYNPRAASTKCKFIKLK